MKVYELYKVNGFAGDPYYCIESKEVLGYYLSKEKAEQHPEYQNYLEEERLASTMEDDNASPYIGMEPFYAAIREIDVIE